MSSQVRNKPTEDDWLDKQPELKRLYDEDTLAEVMEVMKKQPCIKSQYEKHFRDWKWSKNHRSKEWKQLCAVLEVRRSQKKKTDVYLNGEPLPPDKLRKELSRHKLSVPERLSLASDQELPRGFAIRTPTSFEPASLTFDLPFHIFENNIQHMSSRPNYHEIYSTDLRLSQPAIDSDLIAYNEAEDESWYLDDGFSSLEEINTLMQPPLTGAESATQAILNMGTLDYSVPAALHSVVPPAIAEKRIPYSSASDPDHQMFASHLYRQLLFSVANNYAGLGALQVHDVFRVLKEQTNSQLYQLMRLAPGYTSRAIAQNLFKGAIETGDARIVKMLLEDNFAHIDVNEQICFFEGNRYSVIERASLLRHREVIEILLKYQADVNNIHSRGFVFKSAFDCAVRGQMKITYTRVDHRIFRMLLGSGCDLSCPVLFNLLNHKDEEFVELIMAAHAQRNAAKWTEDGTFAKAILCLDDPMPMRIIYLMHEIGADLNYWVEGPHFESPSAHSIIDAAALRGSLEMVEILFQFGASMTRDTLLHPLTSGSEILVRFLLEEGADVHGIKSLNLTPLGVAIRLKNGIFFDLLTEYGALDGLHDQARFSAALEAAAEVGNTIFIEHLLKLRGTPSGRVLRCALVIAIRADQDEAAEMLIEAGADTDYHNSEEAPLIQALSRRNATLIFPLLEADALSHRISGDAMRLAAEWGDRSVIEALISARAASYCEASASYCGASTGSIFISAVTHRDQVLIQLLLDAGLKINCGGNCDAVTTALNTGDPSMAYYLLNRGAEPCESWSLENEIPYGTQGLWIQCSRTRRKRDLNLVERMLATGYDANGMVWMDISNPEMVTPFGLAVLEKQGVSVGLIDLFLRKGCRPNNIVIQGSDISRNRNPSTTAFLAAISTGSLPKVKVLLKNGADVNLPSYGAIKRTPLQKAAEAGDSEMIKLLINYGAKVNAPAAKTAGGTALQLAAIGGYFPVVLTLLEHNAEVDGPASRVNGRTALEGAAEHGRLDMLKLILNKGAGGEGKDKKQFARAMKLARENGNPYICGFLESHLARLSSEHDANMTVLSHDGNPFFS